MRVPPGLEHSPTDESRRAGLKGFARAAAVAALVALALLPSAAAAATLAPTISIPIQAPPASLKGGATLAICTLGIDE